MPRRQPPAMANALNEWTSGAGPESEGLERGVEEGGRRGGTAPSNKSPFCRLLILLPSHFASILCTILTPILLSFSRLRLVLADWHTSNFPKRILLAHQVAAVLPKKRIPRRGRCVQSFFPLL
ncbi:hypothetical protein EYF80_011103 [Liparis tanakae]|uniref:Uncharacterized protein n=1 Tax=Liparis tanakae TaxID=230148 RepID=A0A4Z2IL07_9TELE|nr:hypothetical protein EYF80_011103 [Liparis tanakae]